MRRLYDWIMGLAGHPRAPQILFWVSFVESSVFPIPPDVMLIPMILARRAKAWAYATIATMGSVLGGLAGYAIGYFLFEYVGQPILNFYGYANRFEELADLFRRVGRLDLNCKGLDALPL